MGDQLGVVSLYLPVNLSLSHCSSYTYRCL